MQKLEKLIVEIRSSSPTDRVCAQLAPDGLSVTFHALSVCESCASEIALGDGFTWAEWGWYRGDYNRAQAYADATVYAHHAQDVCKKDSFNSDE